MTKFVSVLLSTVLVSSFSAAVAAEPASSFSRDGETYSYVIAEKNNVTVINGKVLSTGQPFTLRVRNGHVAGFVGTSLVSFDLPAFGKALQTAAR
jgi:hypothetical protein